MMMMKFKSKKELRNELKENDIIKCEGPNKNYVGIILKKNNSPLSFKIYFIKHSKKYFNQKFYVGILCEPPSTYTIWRKEN